MYQHRYYTMTDQEFEQRLALLYESNMDEEDLNAVSGYDDFMSIIMNEHPMHDS